jgi:hypothetical protein
MADTYDTTALILGTQPVSENINGGAPIADGGIQLFVDQFLTIGAFYQKRGGSSDSFYLAPRSH